MFDLYRPFERFLFRDLSFLLGGSIVIDGIFYVYPMQGLFSSNLPVFLKYLIEFGVAYVLGYVIQDFLTMLGIIRTVAGRPPSRLGMVLYRRYEQREEIEFPEEEYEMARLWLYNKAPERYRNDHERIESLKQVGTAVGPCLIIAGAIRLLGGCFSSQSSQCTVAIGLIVLGTCLCLLGWLKVTQQGQRLVRIFRANNG